MTDPEHTVPPAEAERPPDPPEVDRGFRLHWYQWVAVPAMLAVSVLALAGAFGESRDAASSVGRALALHVDFPTRFRYKQIEPLLVHVTNRSGARLDTVTLAFDTLYLRGFSTVQFTPSAARAYEVELIGLRPGETRLVVGQLQAEQYWRHAGEVRAMTATDDNVRVRIGTLVFP